MTGIEAVTATAGSVSVAAALLLIAAAAFKLIRPEETTGALAAVGLPSARGGVRALAALELSVAAWVIGLPSSASFVALMLMYAGFAVFVVLALAAGVPLRSCGCFGRLDTPPSPIHLALDAAVAILAFIAAVEPEAAMGPLEDAGAAAWLGIGVLAYLGFGMMTALPLVTRRTSGR